MLRSTLSLDTLKIALAVGWELFGYLAMDGLVSYIELVFGAGRGSAGVVWAKDKVISCSLIMIFK